MKQFVCYCGYKKYRLYESDNNVYICSNCGLVYDAYTYNYRAVLNVVNVLNKLDTK